MKSSKTLLEDKYMLLASEFGELRVRRDEPMSAHTYFRIGGNADFYFEAHTTQELVSAVRLCRELKVPFFILGGGANILVSDQGIRGLVIRNRANNIRVVAIKGSFKPGEEEGRTNWVYVEAESGALINQLVRFTLDESLEGLEFLLSVPGTIGGGLKINAHFRPEKNEFLGNALYQAKILTPKNEVRHVEASYFKFGYDESVLQRSGDILLSAVFKLKKGDKEKLWEIAMANVKYRDSSQPIGIPCSGCTFRNPVDAKNLPIKAAGYLLEQVGLKGFKKGNVQFSEKHANFIQNLDGATAKDVLELITLAKEKVREKFGVDLKEEIFYAGEF